MRARAYKNRELEYAKARELRTFGHSYRVIAEELGNVSWRTIAGWVKDIKGIAVFRRGPIPKQWHALLETVVSNRARRLCLIRIYGHVCSVCALSVWNEDPIPLELDHIDGNRTHNSFENCRLICPNCHAQTKTYKGKNIKKFA